METQQLVSETQKYITNLFKTLCTPDLVYHNLDHTLRVVNNCRDISHYYKINGENQLCLLVAAWFHDTGYLFGPANGH